MRRGRRQTHRSSRRRAFDHTVSGSRQGRTHHPGISAKQLQRQLGLSRYETAWLILQKLRRAMVAPERSLLTGEVEIDEFWLGGYEEGLKGSRQRGKKALVAVAAIEVRGPGSGRLRLQVLANPRAKTLQAFTQATTAPGSIVHTDGLKSYAGLATLGYQHRPRKQTGAARDEQLLPRVHRAISNLKAWMHGTHRGVSNEHLPVYLDEFVFRDALRWAISGQHRPDDVEVWPGHLGGCGS